MTQANSWGSDVRVSLPDPLPAGAIRLDMGSHAFTDNGLAMNVSRADLEQISTPTYAPMDAT